MEFPPTTARERLSWAIVLGDMGEVRNALIAGADLEALNEFGETALSEAVSWRGEKAPEVVQMLLDHGAPLVAGWYLDEDGQSPRPPICSVAAMFGSPAVMEVLLDAGADPNERSAAGLTPLFYALPPGTNGQLEKVRILLAAGADPRLGRNKAGRSLLEQARSRLEVLSAPGYLYRRAQAKIDVREQLRETMADLSERMREKLESTADDQVDGVHQDIRELQEAIALLEAAMP